MEIKTFNSPLVSIIIPVFNGLKNDLEGCIESLKQQTYNNREIIVVDDKSSDNSIELINHSLANENFRLIKHSENKGLSQSWNDGIKECHGEYVLLIQQDCRLLNKDAISKGIEKLGGTKDVILTGFQKIDYKKLNTYQKLLRFRLNEIEENPFSGKNISITENKCDICALETIKKIGPFSTKLNQSGQDLIFSARAKHLRVSIELNENLTYSISYEGENSLKKLIRKEYKYAKGNITIFRTFHNTGFTKLEAGEKSLGRDKIRSRVLNVILPIPIFLLIIIYVLLLNLTAPILILPYVLAWMIYYIVIIRNRNGINKGLNLPWLKSSIILMILDFVYLTGTIIGLFIS